MTALPAQHKVARSHSLLAGLGIAEERMLRVLARYHYLTALQFTRLLYAPGSLTYVQTKLKGLREAGFVQAIVLPRRTQLGSSPSVYTLARKGQQYLRSLGLPMPPRARLAEERARSYLFLAHTLAVNDVLIAAALLGKKSEAIRLHAWKHDHELQHCPVRITLPGGKRQVVVPDGWLDFRLASGEQVCVVLELDRGTEDQKQWRTKLLGLLAYLQGPYQDAFNTDSGVVAVLTTAGQRRAEELLHWSEAIMHDGSARAVAPCFAFRFADPAAVPPADLFLAPLWAVPFVSQLAPLVY